MNISAVIADGTNGGLIHPFQVQESCHSCVQLNVVAPKVSMGAYLTPDGTAVDFDGGRLLGSEDTLGPSK